MRWLLILSLLTACRTVPMTQTISDPLRNRLTAWEAAGPTGDAEHRAKLEALVTALRAQRSERGHLDVLFVCTHNSRRSHMAQVLAIAAAKHVGLPEVRTFSGGTEVTAFNPRAVAALRRAGVEIQDGAGGENPRFTALGQPMFSKRIDDAENPSRDFVAVMTCTQADAACPFVKGATRRVSVPYEDPKVADGTEQEALRYDERVEQIGRDLVWVMRALKNG